MESKLNYESYLKGKNYIKLGICNLYGCGIDTNHDKAFKYFKKSLAKNKDNVEAKEWLVLCHLNGFGTPQSEEEAWILLQGINSSFSFMKKGKFYLQGITGILEPDYKKALLCFNLTLKEGKHTEVYLFLGHMYEHGFGCEKDSSKAIEWYKKSADSGYAHGMYKLGMMYILINDLHKAFVEFIKSAELNDKEAIFQLGHMCEYGFGCEKDSSKAIEWYKKSADSGSALAMYKLALYYKEVEKNEEKILHYLTLSADGGYKLAQFALGSMYEHGFNNSKQDLVKSLKYYELSKKNGQEINLIKLNGFIKKILSSFLTKLKNLVENYKYDRSLLDKSKKYKRYNYNIGVLHYKLNNLECAFYYFEEVAYLNFHPAQKALGYFYKKKNNSDLSSMWYNLSRGIINID